MSQSHDQIILNLTENMPINQLVNQLIGLSLKDCLITDQLVRRDAQDSAPKGSLNKNRNDVTLSPFQTQLHGCIRSALALIGLDLGIVYFVYDGALGNNAGLQAVKQAGLHLICKLRHDSTLYFPYAGEYSGKGKPRKFGDKLTLATLTADHLKTGAVEKTSEPVFTRCRFGTRTSPNC